MSAQLLVRDNTGSQIARDVHRCPTHVKKAVNTQQDRHDDQIDPAQQHKAKNSRYSLGRHAD